MAFSKAVQFRGIKNAVKAYENKKVPAWGLFQGTQFLEKYEGEDLDEGASLLNDYLNALDQRSNDMNTYTLCIYETPGKITSASKYDASFNFRLTDNIDEHQVNKIAGIYEQRISGLEKTIAELQEPEEPEPPTAKDQLYAVIGRILEHPQVQQVIVTKVLNLVDGLGDTITGVFKPNKVAAIGATKTDAASENAKLQEAVNILVEIDPQLGTNLLKLAGIAKADPSKYNLLISMLKGM
jgi:hypothetical protein